MLFVQGLSEKRQRLKSVQTRFLNTFRNLKNTTTFINYFFFTYKNSIPNNFFGLIQEALPQLNHLFKIALTTFIRYQKYITKAIKLPYSNAKLEATNKLIRDIKRNAFGYRNCDNFKKRIYLALNSKKARTTIVLARA